MKGICIINESFYLDERVKELVLEKFNGICFASKQQGFDLWVNNQTTLNRSMDLNGSNESPMLTSYFDEPISTPNEYSKGWNLNTDVIVGETFRNIWRIKKQFITLTTYTTLLIFSQLFKWRILHLLYGKRFSMVWIKLGQKNIPDLIKWATDKGKMIWFYSELPKEELIKELEKL